jgi:leader peptidase (prepilin peptidase)/N-methyltransferase
VSFLVAALGLLAGSIVNWMADVLPVYRGLRRPACGRCGAPRPVGGWIGLTSRACTYCGGSRGVRAVLVEAVAVGLALWLYLRYTDPFNLVSGAAVAFVFLLIAVIDIEHRLILRVVVFPAAVVLGVLAVLNPARGPARTLAGGLAGFVILWLMYVLGLAFSRWLSRRRRQAVDEVAFGYGDVMLGGLIGLVVGWPGVLVAVVTGVLLAGVASLAYVAVMLVGRRYTPFAAIPYGPFLIVGACLVYYGGRPALESLLGGA